MLEAKTTCQQDHGQADYRPGRQACSGGALTEVGHGITGRAHLAKQQRGAEGACAKERNGAEHQG